MLKSDGEKGCTQIYRGSEPLILLKLNFYCILQISFIILIPVFLSVCDPEHKHLQSASLVDFF